MDIVERLFISSDILLLAACSIPRCMNFRTPWMLFVPIVRIYPMFLGLLLAVVCMRFVLVSFIGNALFFAALAGFVKVSVDELTIFATVSA